MSSISDSVTITHPTGLHARPAVKFTRLAKSFPDKIRVRAMPDGDWVDAKSVVKVMALKLRSGTVLEMQAEGESADEAILALRRLVERNFDEQA